MNAGILFELTEDYCNHGGGRSVESRRRPNKRKSGVIRMPDGSRAVFSEVDDDTLVIQFNREARKVRLPVALIAAVRRNTAELHQVWQEKQGLERRTSPRINLEVDVGLESNHCFVAGSTTNISSGGLCVATREMRSVGDQIVLTFRLPKSERAISVESEVRWVQVGKSSGRGREPFGMGLQFISPSAEAAAQIGEFVEKRQPRP